MEHVAQLVGAPDLDAAIGGAIVTHFQPIVDLDTGETVAFEALTRLPGSTIGPDQLFAAARRHGRLLELDLACIRSALATASCLPAGVQLFVNVEPSTLDGDLARLQLERIGAGAVTMEITERAIGRAPAALLRAVHQARRLGLRVALDDVGANPDSLAYLPLLQPDVVKLDMALMRNKEDRVLGRTMAGVLAYAERTGATILAEGIETDEHLARALTLGAELGQGWRWGRAAPLPACHTPRVGVRAARITVDAPAASPFALVCEAGLAVRRGRQRTLLQLSHQIEALAHAMPGAILLSAFQHAERFTPDTHRRYADLARACALVAAFGVGLPAEPAPGVRGAAIEDSDPLAGEWTVVALGPQYAGALTALDLGQGEGPERLFEFCVTHERTLVERIVRHLVSRIDRP